jgi:hypothetical protein
MNTDRRRNGLWPYGWVAALLAAPAVWVLLILVLSVTQRWVAWPDPRSWWIVVACAAMVSVIPLALAILDLLVRGPSSGTMQNEALAAIERNRVAYEDMAWREARPKAPPSDDPSLKRFQDLSTEAGKTTDSEALDALVEEAEALGQRRAYLCPAAEITTEAKSHLYSLADWGVPQKKLDSLTDAAGPALKTPLKDEDVPAARGALHVIFEEYDAWASYIDEYNANTSFWASTFLGIIAVFATAALFLMLGLSWRVLALVVAAVVGATASVIARLPGLTSYGEWVVNLRAYQARIGTGIVGSLVGIGLIGSGLLTISLPKDWISADRLLVACLRSCPAPECPDAVGPAPAPAPLPGTTGAGPAPSQEPKATCDPGGLLFLIALTMLLGFSERILTTLEGRVIGPGAGGPAASGTAAATPNRS